MNHRTHYSHSEVFGLVKLDYPNLSAKVIQTRSRETVMNKFINSKIESGQSLWFVPVHRVYGPQRDIQIYQTGAVWAYFKDEHYESRISLQTKEPEFQEGKVYQSREQWLESGDYSPSLSTLSKRNRNRIALIEASEPLIQLRKEESQQNSYKFG